MIRALYTAASAMLFGMRQQDIAADNLANTRTSGYKAETSAAGSFAGVLARRVDAAQAPIPVQLDEVLGRIGTGVYQAIRGNDFSDGALQNTGDPLDVAVMGNGFFVVQTPQGLQYTRDGHFGRDLNNRLVTAQGLPVLDVNGAPIVLDTDHIRIKSTGDILIGEETVATLRVVSIDQRLAARAGSTRFSLPEGAEATNVTLGSEASVSQGMLEEANVNAARTASLVLSTSRAFEASQHVFSTIDETLERAISQIGKV